LWAEWHLQPRGKAFGRLRRVLPALGEEVDSGSVYD
jgi:hypothetical protein